VYVLPSVPPADATLLSDAIYKAGFDQPTVLIEFDSARWLLSAIRLLSATCASSKALTTERDRAAFAYSPARVARRYHTRAENPNLLCI
jgi:hypothetical protein